MGHKRPAVTAVLGRLLQAPRQELLQELLQELRAAPPVQPERNLLVRSATAPVVRLESMALSVVPPMVRAEPEATTASILYPVGWVTQAPDR